jgi:RNA-directed DNA polymerase
LIFVVAHCKTQEQAQQTLAAIERRLKHCRLELHPDKTRIVYCQDDDRRGGYPETKFDFLSYTFRARRSTNRWGITPAVSNAAAKAICDAPGDAVLAPQSAQ